MGAGFNTGGAGRSGRGLMAAAVPSLAAFVAVLLSPVAPASAGTFRVLACDAAPRAVNNAWVEHEDRSMVAGASCPSRGDPRRGLAVRNRVDAGKVRDGKGAAMLFRAPAGARLRSIDLDWDGRRVNGDWGLGLVRGDGRLLAGCRPRPGSDRVCRVGDPKGAARIQRRLSGSRSVRLEARCAADDGCATDARRRPGDRTRARLAAHRAVVVVGDGSDPNLVPGGPLLGGGWQRGRVSAEMRATDNVGVRATRLTTGGTTRALRVERCDYTRPVPCPGGTQASHELDTADLRDGRHAVSLAATDAAGNERVVERIVRIDNHAPARVSGIRVLGTQGVRSTNSFDVRWDSPPGQVAPIARAHYRLCRAAAPQNCVQGTRAGGVGGMDDLSVPSRGSWRLRVWLEDAAGNTTADSASASVTLRFDDRTPARLETGFAAAGGGLEPRATVTLGTRAVLRGSLSGAAGAPVSGGPISVVTRVRGADRFQRVGQTRTDASGDFRLRLPSGPSRRVVAAFHGDGRHRPASAGARLVVRAGSSLRVSRHRVRNGDRVRFSGRLMGGWVPSEGKLLQLEAFYRDRWRTFALVRTDSGGRWHRGYRFGGTRGRVRYPFRARIPRERGYPYAVGRSRTVHVTVTAR